MKFEKGDYLINIQLTTVYQITVLFKNHANLKLIEYLGRKEYNHTIDRYRYEQLEHLIETGKFIHMA